MNEDRECFLCKILLEPHEVNTMYAVMIVEICDSCAEEEALCKEVEVTK